MRAQRPAPQDAARAADTIEPLVAAGGEVDGVVERSVHVDELVTMGGSVVVGIQPKEHATTELDEGQALYERNRIWKQPRCLRAKGLAVTRILSSHLNSLMSS